MNFKNLLFLSFVALAFAACGDDDDGPSKSELLTTPTWVVRVYVENGVTTTVPTDDCDYDDTVKFTTTTVTFDANDDTSCGGVVDEQAITLPMTFNEANDEIYVTFIGADTLSVNRLTSTELWLETTDGADSEETRYIAQ